MIYTSNSSVLSLSRFLFREGCRLQYLIATTYTVDCETLLSLSSSVYQALSAAGDSPPPEEDTSTRLVDLCLEFPEIMSCAQDHIRLYTQYAPDQASRPRALCENAMALFAVCGKVMAQPYPFHPKLLLAVFERDGKQEFQLQAGSKNLTVSNALDLSVCLESGQPSPAGGHCNGSQLAGFFRACKIPLPEGVAEALEQTNFQIRDGDTEDMTVSHILFGYNRPGQTLSDLLQQDMQRWPPIAPVHVFSPFLAPDSLGTFWKEAPPQKVVYHTNLTRTLLKQGQGKSFPNLYIAKAYQAFYHGKLMIWPVASQKVAQTGTTGDPLYDDTFRIWVGSANATQNGMRRNSELMVGFLMKVRHSSTGRVNRYPNYFYTSPPRSHTLLEHFGRQLSGRDLSFGPAGDLSHLSEEDCFPEDQGPLLRRLVQNLSLRACLERGTPTLEVEIRRDNPSDTPYSVRICLGDRTQQTLPYQKTLCRFAEKEFPPGGVYEIILLDQDDHPVVTTCLQAKKEDGVEFPPPTSLLTLLWEMTARQAIPNCAAKGFSRPEDDLYQRLRAFLTSYDWDGSAGHPAFRRLEKRLDRIVQYLHTKTDAIYMADPEKKKFEELCAVVCALRESAPHREEAGE